MFGDLTKDQKRALREAARLAHEGDRSMGREDRDVFYLEARTSDLPIVVAGAVVKGVIAIEDIPVHARELVADFAERLRGVSEAMEKTSRPDTVRERYDPDAVVSLSAVVASIDALHDDAATLYVNRRTGEVYVPGDEFIEDELESEDDSRLESESPEGDVDEPAWMREERTRAREIASGGDWVAVIDKYDIDDFDIMRRFARRAGPAASRDLEDALHGRGAFRRFNDVIRRRGMESQREAFRQQDTTDLVRSALEALGIAFRR